MPSQFPLHLKNCFLDEGKEIYEKLTCLLISDCYSSLPFFVASPIQLPTSPNGIFWIKQLYDDVIIISSMRRSVSSPDETLRREWKNDTQQTIFDKLRGVSCGDETLLNAWYYFSNKIILEGKIKNAKKEQFFIWLHWFSLYFLD